jgi:hypothetical protein
MRNMVNRKNGNGDGFGFLALPDAVPTIGAWATTPSSPTGMAAVRVPSAFREIGRW